MRSKNVQLGNEFLYAVATMIPLDWDDFLLIGDLDPLDVAKIALLDKLQKGPLVSILFLLLLD